jgi:phosphohistidine phosphatase SixA
MFVGHNPAMNSLAQQLVSNQHLVKKFPPGTFLEIHWAEAGNWSALEKGKGSVALYAPPKSVK